MADIDKAEPQARFIVLFDIDGTLITGPDKGPSAGFLSMSAALLKVTGKDGRFMSVDFAGRTDVQIARALLVASGEPSPTRDRVADVVDRYVGFLPENMKTTPYSVLGSPRRAVARLREEGAMVALGTGNVRVGGELKLENAGIFDLFDMDKGGYGDDGDTRADLLRAGVLRCSPTGSLPVIIVGDTPHDVSAAHEIGAKCVGVPYRQNDAATLEKAGADTIVDVIDESLVSIALGLLEGGAP
ncbi:MAG: HAD family hydrolase [Deltaproteobacteria bacterium]|nr:HAD family hydrolase [Deltaproteobacteria bacterium]